MKAALLAAVAVLALGGTARAQRFSNISGEKLIQLCASGNPRDVEGCTAYIDGVADSVAFYQGLRPANGSKGAALPGYVCIPGNTTGVQLRQSVVEWYRKHQDQAKRVASGVVLRALDEAFPCPGERRGLPRSEP